MPELELSLRSVEAVVADFRALTGGVRGGVGEDVVGAGVGEGWADGLGEAGVRSSSLTAASSVSSSTLRTSS